MHIRGISPKPGIEIPGLEYSDPRFLGILIGPEIQMPMSDVIPEVSEGLNPFDQPCERVMRLHQGQN